MDTCVAASDPSPQGMTVSHATFHGAADWFSLIGIRAPRNWLVCTWYYY